jgi:hypothetical protein
LSPRDKENLAILWLAAAAVIGSAFAVPMKWLQAVLIIAALVLAVYGSIALPSWLRVPLLIIMIAVAAFGFVRLASRPNYLKETLRSLVDWFTPEATPTPMPTPSPPPKPSPTPKPKLAPSPKPTPSPTPSPSPTPTATATATATATPPKNIKDRNRQGFYYVSLINSTAKPIKYQTFTSPETFELPPYSDNHFSRTHWWSSPDSAKVRVFQAAEVRKETEPWQELEAKYFDHSVPRDSKERELVPVFQFIQEGNRIEVRLVPELDMSSVEAPN